ncbi:MAG: membrane lipoprotein lipid attachment site-containing protein [Colwellia sp.]
MKKFLFILLSIFTLAACQSTPVYNIEKNQVPAGLSVEQVEKSIVLGLIQKGWSVKSNANGVILADIKVRTHSATIEIQFDTTQYSINYVDSANLKYDSTKNTIHKNYNNWIIYIERLIQTGLIEESYKE